MKAAESGSPLPVALLPPPRVSILIPNFNNGRTSSASGDHDFLARLLESLVRTLLNDPTPFEVLAHDDGSTDDSLDTLSRWAAEARWPGVAHPSPSPADDANRPLPRPAPPTSRPFFACCTAGDHVGVLSVVANHLARQARGDILVRLDGDITCITPNWVSRLAELFDAGGPDLGVIGPKQLGIDGRIHAFGDAILHPQGYHHIGHGAARNAFDAAFPDGLEVDHVMGAFYCCRRSAYDALGGFDESLGRGQTIDFGLRARLAGYRCMVTPRFEFEHAHKLRFNRATGADGRASKEASLRRFEAKWGFSRLTPDLARVQRLYAGTPLLWHAGLRGQSAGLRSMPSRAASPGAGAGSTSSDPRIDAVAVARSRWARYAAGDAGVRREVDWQVALALDLHRQAGPRQRIAIVGCGDGLTAALIARQTGAAVVGVDGDPHALEIARQMTGRQAPSGSAPQIVFHACTRATDGPTGAGVPAGGPLWPLESAAADLLLLCDPFDGHADAMDPGNPAATLRESVRVLRPGGYLIIVQPVRPQTSPPAPGATPIGVDTNPGATRKPVASSSGAVAAAGEVPWWWSARPWDRDAIVNFVVAFGGFGLCPGSPALATSPGNDAVSVVFARVAEACPPLAGDCGLNVAPPMVDSSNSQRDRRGGALAPAADASPGSGVGRPRNESPRSAVLTRS